MKKLFVLILAFSMLMIGCAAKNEQEQTEEINKEWKVHDELEKYLWEEAKNTFSPYYQLIGYDISNYEENKTGEEYEVLLNYQIIYKNFDKDPDTVDYIKKAKQTGDKNYQILYNEYLEPKEMNMYFKAKVDKEGKITLFTDVDPTTNAEWHEIKMQDFIIDNW